MDNLYNIRWEGSRLFMDRKKEYLKDNINGHAVNSKNKNIRHCIEECIKRAKARSNLAKDENCNLLADSHIVLNRWKKYFSVIERTYSQ
jgi:hypothetical protein